ncbi:MAG: HPr kinase/phosphorylase, partial [Candidatus Kapaibacterium sp.]
MNPANIQIVTKESITVHQLLESPLNLTHLNTEVPLDNLIHDGNIHRPQLALTGFTALFTSHRVQLLGNTECHFLQLLSDDARVEAFV